MRLLISVALLALTMLAAQAADKEKPGTLPEPPALEAATIAAR